MVSAQKPLVLEGASVDMALRLCLVRTATAETVRAASESVVEELGRLFPGRQRSVTHGARLGVRPRTEFVCQRFTIPQVTRSHGQARKPTFRSVFVRTK